MPRLAGLYSGCGDTCVRFALAGCEAQHGVELVGYVYMGTNAGAGADSVPITSAPVRPPSGADGVLSGDSAPFLEKSRGPCHRPFWLHRYRHCPYKTSCYRHHTLPRLVSHTDPSLLMGIGPALSHRPRAADQLLVAGRKYHQGVRIQHNPHNRKKDRVNSVS